MCKSVCRAVSKAPRHVPECVSVHTHTQTTDRYVWKMKMDGNCYQRENYFYYDVINVNGRWRECVHVESGVRRGAE